MRPMERVIQKNYNSENINNYVNKSNEDPTDIIIYLRMKNQEEKRDGVISEFDQWCRNKNCRARQEEKQNPNFLLPFRCLKCKYLVRMIVN